MINDWIEARVAEFEASRGRFIDEVWIDEMAFVESGADGKPVFERGDCPFLQAGVVHLLLRDGARRSILTYQNDDACGLFSREMLDGLEDVAGENPLSIFRTRRVAEFPSGPIVDVSVARTHGGDISEVLLIIGAQPVLLKAGEVYERHDGSVQVCADDESVLMFLHPDDKQRVFLR